jgi:protein required for attachment to host cells
MNATCIVSANAGRARIFLQARPVDRLEEIADLVNTTARQREADLETDSIGQRSASKSRHSVGQPTQPSGYQPNLTPAQNEAEKFARDVAGFLVQAHQEGRFGKLCLVASPEFLGVLRKQVEPRLGAAVSVEINKDYTHESPEELRERLEDHSRRH